MLGPLPAGYRVIVSVCALLAFAGLGAWVAHTVPATGVPAVGAGIGAALGIVAALLLLHDSHTAPPRPQHARAFGRRRRG